MYVYTHMYTYICSVVSKRKEIGLELDKNLEDLKCSLSSDTVTEIYDFSS